MDRALTHDESVRCRVIHPSRKGESRLFFAHRTVNAEKKQCQKLGELHLFWFTDWGEGGTSHLRTRLNIFGDPGVFTS